MSELYTRPGRPAAGCRRCCRSRPRTPTVSSTGDKLIYHDFKGYESHWRKHHTSSVTRDVWVYDVPAKHTPS